MGRVPEQARLDEIALPRILLDLFSDKFSGAITLSRDKVGKRFLFQKGIPIFAESTLTSESLGVQLMDSGKLSRLDYSKVVTYVGRNACKEGKALLDLQLIDAKGLFMALKEQIRLRLVECFSWPYGDFIVDSREAPPEDAQHFRTDVYQLLQRGLEAHWGPERILNDLEPHLTLFPSPTKRLANLRERLFSDEAVVSLFDALDGSSNFFRAVQLANTPRAMAAAWILDASGALQFSAKPTRADSVGATRESVEPDVEIVFEQNRRSGATQPAKTEASPARVAGAVSAEQSRHLTEEIESRFERLGAANDYECLGVEPDADASEIKRIYLIAAKQYHPDALARSGIDDDVRRRASSVFAEIGVAYAVLSNPAKRADYDASLASPDAGIDVEALTQAEMLFRKGEILLQAGNFRGAIEYLQPAVDIWPEEAAYQASLGWSLYKKLPSEPERALEHLERAGELDGMDGVIQFRLSVVLRALGETERAAGILERAKTLESKPR